MFVFLFVSIKPLFATESGVVINEFYVATPDWIEFYVFGEVDLASYRVEDEAGNSKNLNETTCVGNYCVLEWSNRLNVDPDTIINLIDESTGHPVNTVSYGDDADVLAPGDNQTAGRIVDGVGEWVIFDDITKGMSNNDSKVFITPTPSPTPTPTPTRTPTPTKTPTPEPEATNTPTPSETPMPTNTPTSIPKKSRIVSLFLPTSKPEAQIDAVLGEATSEANTFNLDLGGLFMSLGGLFVAGAGFYVAQLKARPFIT